MTEPKKLTEPQHKALAEAAAHIADEHASWDVDQREEFWLNVGACLQESGLLVRSDRYPDRSVAEQFATRCAVFYTTT